MADSLPPHGLYSPWNSPGQNTGVGSLSLLQEIFPTQGSNSDLPHCRCILYQLSHKGSPLNAYKQSVYCFTWGKHQAYWFIIHEVIRLRRLLSLLEIRTKSMSHVLDTCSCSVIPHGLPFVLSQSCLPSSW